MLENRRGGRWIRYSDADEAERGAQLVFAKKMALPTFHPTLVPEYSSGLFNSPRGNIFGSIPRDIVRRVYILCRGLVLTWILDT